MSRNVAFPFLTIPDECIDAQPWFVNVDGCDLGPAKEYVADWDYATKLQFSRTVGLQFEAAANFLGIPADSLKLGLLVEVGTGAGRLPRKVLLTEFYEITPGSPKADIAINLRSGNLSSFLWLSTTIVLNSEPCEYERLSPRLERSKLWSERFVTRLDGEEPRFPIEVASFTSLFGSNPESRAPWYFSWTPGDWNRDFHGAVRLYLNNDISHFIETVQSGDSFVLQSISVDVVGQILEKFVAEPDAEDLIVNAPAGSLAAQAASWIKLAWPDTSLSSLKQKLDAQPGLFRACIWSVAESQEEL